MEAEMAIIDKLTVKNQDLLAALKDFFSQVLQVEDIRAVLVPQQLPMKNTVMPVLITDPERLEGIDPLSPAYPLNTAKIVSKLSRKAMGAKIAVVMRPCEIRAFFELVKLKQGRTDELVIISLDCLGAYRNTDYVRVAGDDAGRHSMEFIRNAMAGKPPAVEGIDLAAACKVCEHPIPQGADIAIGLLGVDIDSQLLIAGQTDKGDELLMRLDFPSAKVSEQRESAVAALVEQRTAERDKMFNETHAATENLEKLTAYLAGCVNCYNCRVACPVCYCKECVFVTDVFNHEPSQYLQWALRRGAVKMPTDTVFYHLTRLAHMSTACVGCGQCSNACPNDIPVMELFRTVAHQTQQAFGYQAGRSLDEKPPLSEFREDEFKEVVGMGAN
jgi:formate dehydrogenase subunit beta